MTDKEYEKERNLLIPFAVKHADEKEGKDPGYLQGRNEWIKSWNTSFLIEMDRLAKEFIK